MSDKVIIKIDGDSSGYEKTLKGIGSATKAGLADVKAGIDLATAAMQKLAAVAQKGIEYNATIEQMQTSFEVMTGSAEKAAEVVERLRTMGAETPFETADLVNTTQLLMQYGFTADDAIDKMRMLGDIAQGNTEHMNSIAMGYAQMSSAGKVNLQDIKQMINGGFNPLQEISERTGESMASLYDRISKGTLTIDEITQSMVNATSEGGKFYQSMEKQSQTLSGQLSTLKDNTDQLLGSLTEGFSATLRDNLLPLANNMIGDLQEAFSENGTEGLIDAATEMIPNLLDMMTGGFETGVAAVGKWLPKGAKGLMKAVPGALRSTGSVIIPEIANVLFETAGTIMGGLAGMLPDLIPVILESSLNMAKAIFSGTVDALTGLGEGIEVAMKKIGVVAPSAGEAFAQLVESVDKQTIEELKKTIDVDIETELTIDGYQDKIDTAVSTVEEALKNVPGLSEQEEEKIKQAIIEGSGMDALQAAFDEIGIDSSAATTAIQAAQTNIDNVVAGLGLSTEAAEHVKALAENNASAAEIQAAIESFGINEGSASGAAASITAEMETLDSTLTDLGLDRTTITELRKGLSNNKKQVEVALRLLGMEDSDIETVLSSYDNIAGSLTAGIDGIYKSIADEFTNGIPETDEDVALAKSKIEGIAEQAKERVQQWYDDKVASLQAAGLSGEVFAKEVADATATYESLTASIESTTDTALTQTEDMVGKSKGYCEQQVKVLQDTFGLIKDITTQIDMLTDADVGAAERSRQITIAGITNDAGTQLEAFLITYKEYTDKVRKAEDEYLAALDAAKQAYDKNKDEGEYAAAEEAARKNLEDAKQHASDYYQQYIDQIIAGIMQADPNMGGILKEAVAASAMGKLVQDLDAAIMEAAAQNAGSETKISLEDIFSRFGIDDTGVANLAESMGLTTEQLLEKMQLQLDGDGSGFAMAGADFVNEMNEKIADLLKGKNVDLTGTANVLATAIESGYLLPGINGVDYTNAQEIWNNTLSSALNVTDAVLAEAETSAGSMVDSAETGAAGSKAAGGSKGSDFGSGYVDGINAWASAAYRAGYSLAKFAAEGGADGQESASPSKVARGLGNDFGDGYTLGLQDSMARAALAAKQLTGQIATSADISQVMRISNMPNLQQEIVSANSQTVTPVYLDGQQIASIQGYNNTMQLAWQNTRAAKGVGSR